MQVQLGVREALRFPGPCVRGLRDDSAPLLREGRWAELSGQLFAENGYLLLRGLVPRAAVAAARAEILCALEVGFAAEGGRGSLFAVGGREQAQLHVE